MKKFKEHIKGNADRAREILSNPEKYKKEIRAYLVKYKDMMDRYSEVDAAIFYPDIANTEYKKLSARELKNLHAKLEDELDEMNREFMKKYSSALPDEEDLNTWATDFEPDEALKLIFRND